MPRVGGKTGGDPRIGKEAEFPDQFGGEKAEREKNQHDRHLHRAELLGILQSGAVDALGVDSAVAGGFVEKGEGKFATLEETLMDEKYAVGFKLGNESLRDEVQATLLEMVADGTASKIVAHWAEEEIAHGGDQIDFVLKP